MIDTGDLAKTTEASRFGRNALAIQARLFRLWHRFRADPTARGRPLTRAELIDEVRPLERQSFALAQRHLDSPSRRAEFGHRPVRAPREVLCLRASRGRRAHQ